MMKSPVITFNDVVTYENLKKCYFHCRKGKSMRYSVIAYHMNYQTRLLSLLNRLKDETYKINVLYTFTVHEPKERNITANEFEDKIIQRLLCKYVLEPAVGPKLIYDNYASQPKKGTHMAVNRLVHFMSAYAKSVQWSNRGWVLVADFKKFFYTINHEVCSKQVEDLPIDKKLQKLIKYQINACSPEVNTYTKEPGRGLCIGFQTSQWLAVYFLNELDHIIKEKLHIKYYGRYMDDFYMIHESKEYLEYCLQVITEYVENVLKMTLNKKTHIHPFSQGICFLGYHCTYNPDTHRVETVIRTKSINKMLRRSRKQAKYIKSGRISVENGDMSLQSWHAYAVHGNTEKADNAYNKAKHMIHAYTDMLEAYQDALEDPDQIDKDGFYLLSYSDTFRDKDGFMKLIRHKETKAEYEDRRERERVIANAELYTSLNLSAMLHAKEILHKKEPTKKQKKKKTFNDSMRRSTLSIMDMLGID